MLIRIKNRLNEIVREINGKKLHLHSPEIAFRLYFWGTADVQWLGIWGPFTPTDDSMIPFLIIVFVSKNLDRKIHEKKNSYYVMCLRPTLNNQLELTSLTRRKFYIRRNNNKVDSKETGRLAIAHLLP